MVVPLCIQWHASPELDRTRAVALRFKPNSAHLQVNHLALQRAHRQALKAQVWGVPKSEGRLSLLDDKQILNADAKLSVLIVSCTTMLRQSHPSLGVVCMTRFGLS